MLFKISLETRYILYRVLTNVTFYNVVWLYFYRIYINDGEIGLLDSIAFFIGLLFEIPSGAIADAVGRKKMVIWGQFFVVIGILIQVLLPDFLMFVIGQSILVIGLSFASGSDDALFYSTLRYDPDKPDWERLVTRASKWTLVASLFATIIGAYLHTINPAFPWYLTALATLCSIIVLTGVPDTGVYKVKSKIVHIISDAYALTLSGIGNFRKQKIIFYIPIIIGLQALFYAYGSGILRIILLDRFHFSPFMGSIAIGGIIILSILSIHFLEKEIEKIEETKFFLGLGYITILSLLVSIWDIGYWGLFTLFVLYIGERVIHPFISDGLNKNAKGSDRATVLSIGSFLKAIPYVILAPLIGYLNTIGDLEYFLFGWSIITLLCIGIYLRLRKYA